MKPYNEMNKDEKSSYLKTIKNLKAIKQPEVIEKNKNGPLETKALTKSYTIAMTHAKIDEMFDKLTPHYCDNHQITSGDIERAVQHANGLEAMEGYYDDITVSTASAVLAELGFDGLVDKLALVELRLQLSLIEYRTSQLKGADAIEGTAFITELAIDHAQKYSQKYPNKLNNILCDKEAFNAIFDATRNDMGEPEYFAQFDGDEIPHDRTIRRHVTKALKALSFAIPPKRKS